MKKILLAIDAVHPDQNSMNFSFFLAQLTSSKLNGVFLENLSGGVKLFSKQELEHSFPGRNIDLQSSEHELKNHLIEKNISSFKESCINSKVHFAVHRDRGIPVKNLVEESRFADLIVTSREIYFNTADIAAPSAFIKNVLKNTECPVIIAPNNFKSIDEIVYACDGCANSLFAIKQFTYLFPQLATTKMTILKMTPNGEWSDSNKYKLNEWLKVHYTDIHFATEKGTSDTDLFDCLEKRKNAFVVMGAYGRTVLSQFFRHSYADVLINILPHPLFIAHI